MALSNPSALGYHNYFLWFDIGPGKRERWSWAPRADQRQVNRFAVQSEVVEREGDRFPGSEIVFVPTEYLYEEL